MKRDESMQNAKISKIVTEGSCPIKLQLPMHMKAVHCISCLHKVGSLNL